MAGRKKRSKKPSGTKAESLLKSAVFLADHCLGNRVVERLRAEGLTVEVHLDHFQDGCPDEEWLPVAGERGWVVLTKDQAIRKNPLEMRAVRESMVRMFVLKGGDMTGEEIAQTFITHLLDMGRCLKKHGAPFIVNVSRTSLRLVYPKSESTGRGS